MGNTGLWRNPRVHVVPWTLFPSSVCVGEEVRLGRKVLFFANHANLVFEPCLSGDFAPGRMCYFLFAEASELLSGWWNTVSAAPWGVGSLETIVTVRMCVLLLSSAKTCFRWMDSYGGMKKVHFLPASALKTMSGGVKCMGAMKVAVKFMTSGTPCVSENS